MNEQKACKVVEALEKRITRLAKRVDEHANFLSRLINRVCELESRRARLEEDTEEEAKGLTDTLRKCEACGGLMKRTSFCGRLWECNRPEHARIVELPTSLDLGVGIMVCKGRRTS